MQMLLYKLQVSSPNIVLGVLPLVALWQLIEYMRRNGACLVESIVNGTLLWTLAAVASLEFLSPFHAIGFLSLLLFWAATIIGIGLYQLGRLPAGLDSKIETRPEADYSFKVLASCTAAILVIVVALALLSPPNNADSMIYHLSRVEHWQQAGSLAHYPTAIVRQVSYSPLAEMLILHFRVLSGGSSLSNLVQALAFVGCAAVVMLVARRLGATWRGQVLAAVFMATIPMAILQGSSTQNDLVVSLFLLMAMERLVTWRSGKRLRDALGFGLAIGFAVLTKATAYFFAAPMLGLFFWDTIAARSLRKVLAGLAVAALVLVVNAGHYQRNMGAFGTPWGLTTNAEARDHSPGSLLSSVIRQAAQNFATSSERLNNVIVSRVVELHEMLGLDANNPDTTLGATDCTEWWCKFGLTTHVRHEDYAPNPLHALLVVGAIAILVLSNLSGKSRIPNFREVSTYVGGVVVGGLIYCLMLTWHPWMTRYHLIFFILMAPAIAAIFESTVGRKWLIGGSVILLLAALPPLFDNTTRPLSSVLLNKSWMPKPWDIMFITRPGLYLAYRDAVAAIAGRAENGVGLVMGHNSWEYPLWLMLNNPSSSRVRIEHLCLPENDEKIRDFEPQTLLLVDRPAPPVLTCAQGVFEKEKTFNMTFISAGDYGGHVSIYRRLTDK